MRFRLLHYFLSALFVLSSPALAQDGRVEQDFNFDWSFHLGDDVQADGDNRKAEWKSVRLPHDWSVEQGFTQEKTGASTGFLPGGIGWYRKEFTLPDSWSSDRVALVFDGIYLRSEIWLNGKKIGGRPSGFVSFDVELTPHAHFGNEKNELLVRVDHSNYLDTRWYCGSGIYRDVHLIKSSPSHIPEWGIWVQTPEITEENASISVTTELSLEKEASKNLKLSVEILDPQGKSIAAESSTITPDSTQHTQKLNIAKPQLWDIDSPQLYQAVIKLEADGKLLDDRKVQFGIRTAVFDANQGFLLNGRQVGIKGVNLHHDAGLLGVAVPTDVWRDRLSKLRSVGTNAIRTAHNPHASELLELCDEMGFLVMDEFFDEWLIPKDKSLVWLSDNKAPADVTHCYSELFAEWAERDLKATIRRDRNHPSVIMWSIGNEIEWTYPYYPKSSSLSDGDDYHSNAPDFDPVKIRERMAKLHQGEDELLETAKKLSSWAHETDPTRPVTSGLVHPSVGFATGYAQALDVVGFNYRANEYDGAHEAYPDARIIGSENWGTRAEWEAVRDRDFVAGLFIWTGYAYLGEAGPWPRKGLEISLFDYAGFKTPRGHLFEALWKDEPKVWLGSTPADQSEYSYTPDGGWKFTQRSYEPEAMKWLRRWEWDVVSANWNYESNTSTIVQAYGNTEEVELFLNGKSLGRHEMAEFEDHVVKWLVPFQAGELKLVGLNDGRPVASDLLRTHSDFAAIKLTADRSAMSPNRYDVARIELQLTDSNGVSVVTDDQDITFTVSGPARILGVDNGWEKSVQPYAANQLKTWQGRALLLIQSLDQSGTIEVTARSKNVTSKPLKIEIQVK